MVFMGKSKISWAFMGFMSKSYQIINLMRMYGFHEQIIDFMSIHALLVFMGLMSKLWYETFRLLRGKMHTLTLTSPFFLRLGFCFFWVFLSKKIPPSKRDCKFKWWGLISMKKFNIKYCMQDDGICFIYWIAGPPHPPLRLNAITRTASFAGQPLHPYEGKRECNGPNHSYQTWCRRHGRA